MFVEQEHVLPFFLELRRSPLTSSGQAYVAPAGALEEGGWRVRCYKHVAAPELRTHPPFQFVTAVLRRVLVFLEILACSRIICAKARRA